MTGEYWVVVIITTENMVDKTVCTAHRKPNGGQSGGQNHLELRKFIKNHVLTLIMVPPAGLEPARPSGLQILSLLRIPISPRGRCA